MSGETTSIIGQDRQIDARSIVTLIVFFVVNALVIFPVRIPLPLFLPRTFYRLVRRQAHSTPSQGLQIYEGDIDGGVQTPRWYFPLDLATAPVIGALLLLASTCIPGSVVRDGIVGSGGVRPYDIMTLFLSFAYISLSLDCTGLLRYLAFLVASRSSTSGRLLYTTFYLFWVTAGLIVGNDPLILSGTPFLAYFTSHASINPPTAFLFTQFQAANLVSALLVSSNPTNLVLTQAFGISFLSYSAWLALPTVAAAVALYSLLRYFLFRGEGLIPKSIRAPKVDPRSALVDPWGGAFGATLFIATIILLIGLSAGGKLEGVEGVWTVTAPAALIMFVRDGLHDIWARKEGVTAREKEEEKVGRSNVLVDRPEDVQGVSPVVRQDREKAGDADIAGEIPYGSHGAGSQADGVCLVDDAKVEEDKTNVDNASSRSPIPEERLDVREGDATGPTVNAPSPVPVTSASLSTLSPIPSRSASSKSPNSSPRLSPPLQAHPNPLWTPLRRLSEIFPTPSLIVTRLPLPLVPFAFSMFILVEALQYTGWIRVWGGWWASWARVGGVGGCVWLMGTIGVLGCNIFGTNIGATVLLSRVLQQWQATDPNVSSRTLYGAVLALAVGSNFGAYSFVFPASLAGLLWRDILAQKGLHVSRKEFVRWNTLPVVVTMVVGCLVVAGEVCIMYRA